MEPSPSLSSSCTCPLKKAWKYLVTLFKKKFDDTPPEHTPDQRESQNTSNTLLERNFHFNGLIAENILIPRTDIVAVPLEVSYKELVQKFLDCSFSRLPVYENTLDQIVGMVHIKDVLKSALQPDKFSLKPLLRDVLFISPAISLKDLLLEMQNTHIHLALIVDEFGGVDGLITLETVIEKLVGDIDDDHIIKNAPKIVKTDENTYLADARMSLGEFHDITGFSLSLPNRDEDIYTLGGYVIALLGHMPARGELALSQNGLEFEVIDADSRRLNRLRIRLPHSSPSP